MRGIDCFRNRQNRFTDGAGGPGSRRLCQAQGRKVAERVINIAGQFLNIKVDNLGFIYDDHIVSQGIIKQIPFIILDDNSRAAIGVKHIASRLEGIEFKEGGGIKNFILKLMGFK